MPGEKRPRLPEGFVRPNKDSNQPNRKTLHIPRFIAQHVDPDQVFKAEVTDDGILFRAVSDVIVDEGNKPKWA